MTIIAATTDGTDTWIGCDSAVANDEYIDEIVEENCKLIDFGRVVIGMAGSLKALNIVKYELRHEIKAWDEEHRDDKKFVYDVDCMLAKALEGEDYDVVYALNRRVASSSQHRDLYFANTLAAGTGYQYALGAMSVMPACYASIRAGIEAACTYNPTCKRPIYIIKK